MLNLVNRASIVALISIAIVIGIFSLTASKPVFGQATETPTSIVFPPLATQAGFSDSEIDMLQAIGVHIVSENLKFTAYGREYRLLSFMPTPYKEHPEDKEFSIGFGTVLLYRMDSAKPRLVWKRDTKNSDPRVAGRFPLPGNWNQDGLILLGVWEGFWTSGWYQGTLYIYELRSDDTLVSVLRDVVPPGHVALRIETQTDGKLLLIAGDYRDQTYVMGLDKWSTYTCCGPYIHKYFEWRNGKFVDVSAENPDRYFAQLGTALQYVTTTKNIGPSDQGPRLFSLHLLRLLVIYENIGERVAGWNLVQSIVDEAKRSGRLRDGTYVDQVFMPTMHQLFRDGKQFLAPDYLQPNPQPLWDTYNGKVVPVYDTPVNVKPPTPIQ